MKPSRLETTCSVTVDRFAFTSLRDIFPHRCGPTSTAYTLFSAIAFVRLVRRTTNLCCYLTGYGLLLPSSEPVNSPETPDPRIVACWTGVMRSVAWDSPARRMAASWRSIGHLPSDNTA